MPTSLPPDVTAALLAKLAKPNRRFANAYPGQRVERQPLHTMYGGAHLFKAATFEKLGERARSLLAEYAPDARSLADALGMTGGVELSELVHARVVRKLEAEPIEDYRIDFEDGFGIRPDAEEDAEAERSARELAEAWRARKVPPFVGLRVKNLGEEHKARALRTLDLFLTTLTRETGGALPRGFRVTLPKVAHAKEVRVLARALDELEAAVALPQGTVKLELMLERPEALLDRKGRSPLHRLARAAEGRCIGVHFGTYDYTASLGITAAEQRLTHPACDFAKHLLQVAFANTGVTLSDGATTKMPTPPHRGGSLGPAELEENRRVVHGAWREHYANVRHSLEGGFYQGWDLHPGQLPIRYAASFAFFLEGLDAATQRLRHFVDEAARATRLGDAFDDAATGQGLLNSVLRAWTSGAIDDADLAATGLSQDELQTRSFGAILKKRATA